MKKQKWDKETKMAVVLELLKKAQPVSQLCKAHGVSEALAYKWRDAALAAIDEQFSRKLARNGNGHEQAQRERLLQVIGQQAYAIECQKKYLSQYVT